MSLKDILGFEALMARLPGGSRRLLVLTRHFFERLFQNEIIPFEDQMKEKLFTVLAMLAAVGWVLTNTLFSRYMFVEDAGQSWLEKFAFLGVFMIILALAVILEWDVLFPDRRDHLNLRSLPIGPGTLFTAKFLSFLLFVGMFSAAANALSVFGVAFFLPRWTGDSLEALLRYMGAHLLSTTAAFLFVFLFFLFLEAALLAFFGPRAFRAVSLAFRLVFSVLCVVAVLAALVDPYSLQKVLNHVSSLRTTRPTSVLLFPPMWFTGLYETLIGRRDPLYVAGANIGLAAILSLGLADFLAMSFSYRKHIRKSLEVRPVRLPLAGIRAAGGKLFDRLVLRDPVQRAVFHFTGKTLRTSAAHKVRLAGYLAAALGFLLLVLGTRKIDLSGPATANLNILSAPVILGFFVLLGFRSGMNIPYEPEANWIFRLTESKERKHYFIALKKVVLFFALLPLFAVLWIAFAWLWGAGTSFLHCVYGFAWALLAMEGLFWKFARIPFACLVVPGKAKLQMRWLPYLLGFLVAISLISLGERALFKDPGRFPIFFAAVAVILAALEFDQRRFVYPKLALIYEEEPEPVMITL